MAALVTDYMCLSTSLIQCMRYIIGVCLLQFGTNFKQMSSDPTVFSQTTVGMWIEKAVKPRDCTIFVIDNEGCDGQERSRGQRQDLELRSSDIMIINLHYICAGRVEGANLTLLKTLIEVG